jgi:enediyne biosynthesis protein E4
MSQSSQNQDVTGDMKRHRFVRFPTSPALVVAAGLVGISTASLLSGAQVSAQTAAPKTTVAIRSTSTKYPTPASDCAPKFRSYGLAHTTQARGDQVLPYDTNGSGLAVGDLDADGNTDIVLGDLRSTTSVLWNKGKFSFDRKPLDDSDGGISETETRAVSIVDVDNDGKLDIATTHTRGGVSIWHNNGNRTFTSTSIDEVIAPAYAMIWDDIDADGDLDFVTSSYDALLEKEQGTSFLTSAGGGVQVYMNNGFLNGKASFKATRLERQTQTLAMTMFDVDGDSKRDLVVGNDFGVPDMIWSVQGSAPSAWKPAAPFKRITKNTMGFAIGDFDNNGLFDMFASDMKPNLADVTVASQWMPLMERSFQKLQRSSTQRAENVLQEQKAPGKFGNEGYKKHIDATGWSWSTQFGDLDNDGVEDLYVVNGMIDHEVLPYLPNAEIREQNVAYRVTDKAEFVQNRSWGLNSMASGRSMAMADLNNDGRLDIVVNNLRSKSMVYENRLCSGSSGTIRLKWDGMQNSAAFGATIRVRTKTGSMSRLVSPTGGYLTGLDGTVHFGLGKAEPTGVDVVWPDGKVSKLDPNTVKGWRSSTVVITRANPSKGIVP